MVEDENWKKNRATKGNRQQEAAAKKKENRGGRMRRKTGSWGLARLGAKEKKRTRKQRERTIGKA